MAGDVQIKFDERALQRVKDQLRDFPRALPRVMKTGINKTARKGRTRVVRKLAENIKIKQAQIRKRVIPTWATLHKWQAILAISGRRIPLMHFGARQTKKGVTYMINKKTGRKLLPGAFIAEMPSGHKGVFKRKGKARLPIAEEYGPDLGEVFEGAAAVAGTIMQETQQDLARNIDIQTAWLLAKYKARGAA